MQNERDRISVKRQRSQSPTVEQHQQPVTTHSHLSLIQQAENLYAHLRASVITTSSLPSPSESAGLTNAPRLATMNDLADAIKQQLLLLVEWAKSLPPFYDLSLDDQVFLYYILFTVLHVTLFIYYSFIYYFFFYFYFSVYLRFITI